MSLLRKTVPNQPLNALLGMQGGDTADITERNDKKSGTRGITPKTCSSSSKVLRSSYCKLSLKTQAALFDVYYATFLAQIVKYFFGSS
jgi:hypothetical protein